MVEIDYKELFLREKRKNEEQANMLSALATMLKNGKLPDDNFGQLGYIFMFLIKYNVIDSKNTDEPKIDDDFFNDIVSSITGGPNA